MTAVAVLNSGVDSLYFSASGHVIDGLTLCLSRMVEVAGSERVPFSFEDAEPDMHLRLHGWRDYPFWISSPRFELYIGASKPFPAAYIHAVGLEAAVQEVERLLLRHVLPKGFVPMASRVDVYADEQGWEPVHADFHRFVCRGVRRRMYEVPRELHGRGRRLSGFTFGAGEILARVYDKTLETKLRGVTWPALLWEGHDPERPVWRVEFQYRRKALSSFGVRSIGDVLRGRQGLWDYGMKWLSLRQPGKHADRDRWHEAEAWTVLRSAQVGSPRSELVREHVHLADGAPGARPGRIRDVPGGDGFGARSRRHAGPRGSRHEALPRVARSAVPGHCGGEAAASTGTVGGGVLMSDILERPEVSANADPLPMLLTIKDVEEELQLGRTRTYELVRSGELPVIRIGRTVRIP